MIWGGGQKTLPFKNMKYRYPAVQYICGTKIYLGRAIGEKSLRRLLEGAIVKTSLGTLA